MGVALFVRILCEGTMILALIGTVALLALGAVGFVIYVLSRAVDNVEAERCRKWRE